MASHIKLLQKQLPQDVYFFSLSSSNSPVALRKSAIKLLLMWIAAPYKISKQTSEVINCQNQLDKCSTQLFQCCKEHLKNLSTEVSSFQQPTKNPKLQLSCPSQSKSSLLCSSHHRLVLQQFIGQATIADVKYLTCG